MLEDNNTLGESWGVKIDLIEECCQQEIELRGVGNSFEMESDESGEDRALLVETDLGFPSQGEIEGIRIEV